MEKKKKVLRILARVLAIVTALVCTLCMVIPSYAEEFANDMESATADEQETYINQLIEPLGVQLNLAEFVEGLDYSQILFYGFMGTDDMFNKSILTSGTSNTSRDFYVDGHLIININGATVYEWGFDYNRVYIEYMSSGSVTVLWDSVTGDNFRIIYSEDTGLSYRIRSNIGGTSYSLYRGSGYTSYEVQSYSFGKSDIMAYAPFGVVIQPRQILQLNIPSGNDEIYNQGYSDGYQFGFEEGEMHGLEEGMDIGREEGYTEGDADGYRRGYDDGMSQMSLIDLITEILRAPMTLIESALNFDIFGINMSNAVKALVSMALLAVVFTIVWKAVK